MGLQCMEVRSVSFQPGDGGLPLSQVLAAGMTMQHLLVDDGVWRCIEFSMFARLRVEECPPICESHTCGPLP